MDEIRRRATSFGAVAREYESARPHYPAAAVQLVDRVASMSTVAVLAEPERSHVYGRVQELADSVAEPIRLSYVTWAHAFRRRD